MVFINIVLAGVQMFSTDNPTKQNGHEEGWKVLVQHGSVFQEVYEALPGED